MTVAGHTFIDRGSGEVCRDCGKRWSYVRTCTEADIGAQMGTDSFSHYGGFTSASEYEEIVAKRDAFYEAVWSATVGVSS